MHACAYVVFSPRSMSEKRPFVVMQEGDVYYIMQICPTAFLNPSGECEQSRYCDCLHGEDGPLWLHRVKDERSEYF